MKPVLDVRASIEKGPATDQASPELLEKVISMASEFGSYWRLPVTIHLLAISPHGVERHET